MIEIAKQFGASLDEDNFELTKTLLSADCKYTIGAEVLHGPDDIVGSYEKNMLEGREKLDGLVWGKSNVTQISTNEFLVHFTDYLTHKGIEYTHKCSQKLIFNKENKIDSIEHLQDEEEQSRLNKYYNKVGLLNP